MGVPRVRCLNAALLCRAVHPTLFSPPARIGCNWPHPSRISAETKTCEEKQSSGCRGSGRVAYQRGVSSGTEAEATPGDTAIRPACSVSVWGVTLAGLSRGHTGRHGHQVGLFCERLGRDCGRNESEATPGDTAIRSACSVSVWGVTVAGLN